MWKKKGSGIKTWTQSFLYDCAGEHLRVWVCVCKSSGKLHIYFIGSSSIGTTKMGCKIECLFCLICRCFLTDVKSVGVDSIRFPPQQNRHFCFVLFSENCLRQEWHWAVKIFTTSTISIWSVVYAAFTILTILWMRAIMKRLFSLYVILSFEVPSACAWCFPSCSLFWLFHPPLKSRWLFWVWMFY